MLLCSSIDIPGVCALEENTEYDVVAVSVDVLDGWILLRLEKTHS